MPEFYGFWSRHIQRYEPLRGKIAGGLFPGLLGTAREAFRNNSRNFGFEFQVEAERRPLLEQRDLIFAAEVSGRPANTGQPLNAHAIMYLSAQPDRQRIIHNAPEPQNQTWADLARTMAAARGIVKS